jgi:hypothetical protein
MFPYGCQYKIALKKADILYIMIINFQQNMADRRLDFLQKLMFHNIPLSITLLDMLQDGNENLKKKSAKQISWNITLKDK